MGVPVERQRKRTERAKNDINKYKWITIGVVVSGLLISILFAVVFSWQRGFWFQFSSTADNTLLGTYGDFIGGIVGCFFAGVSVILMIQTIQRQIDINTETQNTNEELANQNNLQLFDSQFNTFLTLYEKAVGSYISPDGNTTGRKRMEQLVNSFLNQKFTDGRVFRLRSKAAVDKFSEFYAKHQKEFSVHLRMLYQLMYFILNAEGIEESIKVRYAKAVRGNLTDAEMVLIRYNCYCESGKKMQKYVNEFNLLKHLPLMSLKEFRKWKDLLQDDPNTCNALNVLFLSLHKKISYLLSLESDKEEKSEIACGKRWNFTFICSANKDRLVMIITHNLQALHGGRTVNATETALERLKIDNLKVMFFDFLVDRMFCSNFYCYNKTSALKIKHETIENKEIRYTITSKYPIVMTSRQMSRPPVRGSISQQG